MLFLAALPNLELARAPAVSWALSGPASVIEGLAGAYTITWLGAPLAEGETLAIDVTLTLGTASAGDLSGTLASRLTAALTTGMLLSGTRLTWTRAAARAFSFSLPTVDDASAESSETFTVAIANPSKGTISPAAASVVTTITDND